MVFIDNRREEEDPEVEEGMNSLMGQLLRHAPGLAQAMAATTIVKVYKKVKKVVKQTTEIDGKVTERDKVIEETEDWQEWSEGFDKVCKGVREYGF